jgi:hypothetical protein
MERIDLSDLGFAELSPLCEAIDVRVAELREVEGPALRQSFAEHSEKTLGLSLEELVRERHGKRHSRPTIVADVPPAAMVYLSRRIASRTSSERFLAPIRFMTHAL